jgi:hypothetical protein
MSQSDDWTLDISQLSTRVVGFAADAPAEAAILEDRGLVTHDGHFELMVALSGVTWVAVAAQRAQGDDDDHPELRLSPAGYNSGHHTSAFITPLATTDDGGCDVMLLKPSYGHALWMTRGSHARLIHFAFGDPDNFVLKRKQATHATPKVLARSAGRG